MRILYVVSYYKPAYEYGGPVNSISGMCETLASLGNQVTVLTTNANGLKCLEVPLGQPVDVGGVRTFYYPIARFGPRSYFYSPALAEACRRQTRNNELVVIESLFTHSIGPAAAACRQAGVPYVLPPRGQLLPWALQQKGFKKRLYLTLVGRRYLEGAAALHCMDEGEAAAVRQLRLRTPIFIAPNGIDTARWSQLPPRGTLRARLGIPGSDQVLLFLGRLHRVKRPDWALNAMASLARTDVHLVYAGPDEEELVPHLQARASSLGCGDRVHFAGMLVGDQIAEAFADADLLVMPSAMESFGMSVVEAMSAGLPVLVSDNVPAGRWAEEAGAGCVAGGSAEAFADALARLLADPGMLRATGAKAKCAARRFDILAVAQMVQQQYQSIVATGKPLHRDVPSFAVAG